MFDWDNGFHKVLRPTPIYQKASAELQQFLHFSGWEERMAKRGGAFFAFIRYLCRYAGTGLPTWKA